MCRSILIILVFATILSSCNGSGTVKDQAKPRFSVSDKIRKKASDIGRIPTSIELNFMSGYWHIASGFNVDSLGDFRPYDGTWIDFRENNEFMWGVAGEDKEMGAWGWDEEKQYLYFFSDASEAFFIGEWAANNNGDIVVCVGSTPNNPRSTQYKLVRRHQKIVSE